VLLTTGLMAPEAYTLTAAIDAHVRGGNVREAAAQAYHKYQKCGVKAARRLFR
jgi:pentatricopeptide repeat protein